MKRVSINEDSAEISNYELEKIKNSIIAGDSLKVLQKMPPSSVDCVFIDPPYFLQLPHDKKLQRWNAETTVEGVNDDWDKFESFEAYDEFIHELLKQTRRVMKENATIWVISTYHSIYRLGRIMQDLRFWILNDIIWVKTNPMPNWRGVRFTNATETLIWAVKEREAKNYTFNKDFVKETSIGKVGANVWVLPICSGRERLKDEAGKKLHSTQKPEELLKRIILSSTHEGDIILDPAAGTGTSGYVAKELNRNFIMVEINKGYIEGIKDRFQQSNGIKENKKTKSENEKYLNYKFDCKE